MPQNENYTSILILESSLRRAERFIARGEKDKALDMLMALLRFGAYGIEPDEDSEIYDYIESDLVIMQRARERYNRNIENGKRGGRPKKQFDKELTLQLYNEGASIDKILERLNNCVSRATLYRFLQEANKQQENLSQNYLKSVSKSQNSFEKNFEEKENLSQNLKTVSKPNVNVNVNDNENDNSFSAARNFETSNIKKEMIPKSQNKSQNISQDFETPNIKKETISKSQNKSQNVSRIFETITDENIYEFLTTTVIDNAAYNKIITSVINGSLSNVWECGEEGILNKQTQEFWEKQN